MELCKCGTCEQAFERARGLFEKMMKDNECPIFINAVASALLLYADNGILRLGKSPGQPNLFDKVLTDLSQDVIFDKIGIVALDKVKETNKFVCDLVIEQRERMKS